MTANTNTATTSRRRRRFCKRDADAGEAGAADLAAAAAHAGDTPAFATWALLTFDQPITCPVDSLYIASRFDTDIHQNTCRLAFHGRLVHPIDLEKEPEAVKRIKAFKMKQREGTVERVQDANTAIGKGMFKKETDPGMFSGMEVQTNRGERGVIDGGFGKSGKYKVYFKDGIAPMDAGEAVRMYLRFKRYVFDKEGRRWCSRAATTWCCHKRKTTSENIETLLMARAARRKPRTPSADRDLRSENLNSVRSTRAPRAGTLQRARVRHDGRGDDGAHRGGGDERVRGPRVYRHGGASLRPAIPPFSGVRPRR